ncbi:MAG: DUF4435 domain-containing protein [Candidatus Methanoperedens sp.]|nr:DUF4435 domain-containing protein [Candidatus Methanoperedens sp.]
MRKQDITYEYKLTELLLDISHPNNKGIVFVLLEGESDIRLFRKLFNLSKCKVEAIPGGKLKLEECVGKLVNIYPLIIGIRDADFIHLGAKLYEKTNVFLTDFHDMEMILISEDEVFSSIVFEFTDLPKDKHSEIRNNIMLSIEQIGYLKWLNEKENLEYKFEAGFQDLISFVNLKIDFDQYFVRVLSNSPNAKITDKTIILDKMKVLKATNPNPLQLCNGHDFMKAFSKYIKQDGSVKNVNDEHIASSCRMTFTFNHYCRTGLYLNTKMWADNTKCVVY